MKQSLSRLGRLFAAVRPWWFPYGVSLGMVSCRNLFINLLTAYLFSQTAAAARLQDMPRLLRSAAVFFALLAAFVAFDTAGLYWQGTTVHRMTCSLRQRAFARVVRGRPDAVAALGGNRGDILSRLFSDVSVAEGLLQNNLLLPLLFLVSGIGASVGIFSVSAAMGGYLLLVGALLFVGQALLSRRQHALSGRMLSLRSALLVLLGDLRRHNLAIQLMGLCGFAQERFLKQNADFGGALHEQAKLQADMGEVRTLADVAQYVGVVCLGALLMARGALQVEDLLFVLQLSGMVIMMFGALGDSLVSVRRALAGVDRLDALLTLPQEDLSPTPARPDLDAADALCFGPACVTFGDGTKVRYEKAWRVARGSLAAVRGASGRGKSTLCRLLLGLCPYEGDVRLFGAPVRDYSLPALRELTAYIPQDRVIVAGTVRENLLLGVRRPVSQRELEEACRGAGCDAFLGALPGGYETALSEGGPELSGGQRQSIAVARALLRGAPLLLLDEAFAGIDQKNAAHIVESLRSLRGGRTILVVTHNSEIAARCDSCIEL